MPHASARCGDPPRAFRPEHGQRAKRGKAWGTLPPLCSGVFWTGFGSVVSQHLGERTHAAEIHRFHPKGGFWKLTSPLT